MYKDTIKKEKDVFKYDLTNNKDSYVYYLNKALDSHELETYTDTNKMKARVIEIISQAKDTETKRKFILNLQFKRTCFEILNYVYNSTLNGQGLGTV